MRRILLCWLIIGLLVVSVSAAGSEYWLDEVGMTMEIPADLVVFTRDIQSDDPNLRAYGLTKDELSSLMLEQSIYLNAWDPDINYEIIVTMIKSPFEDYNQFSDTMLSTLISAFEEDYERSGMTWIRSELYQHRQAKFAKIYISQPMNGETVYGLQYHTVYDGKAINLTLHSYSGPIDSNAETVLQEIVEDVRFDTEPQYKTPPAETEAFLYTDPDSGMTFTVPANWVEAPMMEERETLDVKFSSNLEEGLTMMFSSQDILELEDVETELSAGERFFLSRADMDNQMVDKSHFAEIYGCAETDVSMVTYGGKEYYMTETVGEDTISGMSLSVPMVNLTRIENGYYYTFHFFGPSGSAYFEDFEALVTSAGYPLIEDELAAHRKSVVLVVIAAAALVVVVCVRLRRRKSEDCPVVFAPFCHKCGTKCASGSRYCPKCGTKLVAGEEKTWDIS